MNVQADKVIKGIFSQVAIAVMIQSEVSSLDDIPICVEHNTFYYCKRDDCHLLCCIKLGRHHTEFDMRIYSQEIETVLWQVAWEIEDETIDTDFWKFNLVNDPNIVVDSNKSLIRINLGNHGIAYITDDAEAKSAKAV